MGGTAHGLALAAQSQHATAITRNRRSTCQLHLLQPFVISWPNQACL